MTSFSLNGTVHRAKVIHISGDHYKVKLFPQKCVARLMFEHLSDFSEIKELFRLALSKGDFVQKVTPFSINDNQSGAVSRKECLVRAAEGKTFVKSFNNLKKGMLLPGVVTNHQDYGFYVSIAGGYKGLCPATSLPNVDTFAMQDHFPEGRSVLARIKEIGTKGRFLVSVATQDCWDDPVKSITDYLQSRAEVFKLLATKDDDEDDEDDDDDEDGKDGQYKAYCEIEVGSIVEVTVKSVCKNNRVRCQTSSGLHALVNNEHLGDLKPEVGKRYASVVLVVNLLSTPPSLQVSLDPELCKAIKSAGNKNPSKRDMDKTVDGKILWVKKEYLLVKVKSRDSVKLMYVPGSQHFNSFSQISSFKIGMSTKVVIKGVVNGHLIGVLDKKNDADLKVGNILEAVVQAICPLEMLIDVKGMEGRVHITEVVDDIEEGKKPLEDYKVGMNLKVKLIANKTLTSNPPTPFLECSLKPSKMEKTKPEELFSEELLTSRGANMLVFIKSVDEFKISVQASLMHFGSIDMLHVSKDVNVINDVYSRFKVGQALKATVTGKTQHDQIVFSLIGDSKEPDVGMQVVAVITQADKFRPLVLKLSNGFRGLAEWPKVPSPQCVIGSYVKCEVLSLYKKVYTVKLFRTMTDDDKNATKTKKRKRKKEKQSSIKVEIEEEIAPAAKRSKKNPVKEEEDVSIKTESPKKARHGKERLTVEGFGWGRDLDVQQSESDDSDDDDDDDDVEMTPATTDSKSKKKEIRREEKRIDEYEKQQLKGSTGPQSANDFERLVLQSPNSSMVWLSYMAYHLELGEVAKARTVAEKALNTIGFREEQEKKNVWLAYLNIEVMYGEREDLKKLLQRAITYNDPFEIQLKMCDIYIGATKFEDAELQFQVLIRKFKKEKSVWKNYAKFLYAQNKQKTARNMLQKCLITLERRHHVEVITRFACLEFSLGNPERARTMFENLIASYPQRTDIWSVYVDMVVKSGDITGARQLLERGVQQKMNPKKISFLIKKYIRFEETHGTEEKVNKVKDLAVSLFQSDK